MAVATERQIKYLRHLAHERVMDLTPEQIDAHIETVIHEGRERVSIAIDRLLKMPVPGTPEPVSTPAMREYVHYTPNQWAGDCADCGGRVLPGIGFVVHEDGYNKVRHRDCETDYLPEGRYAVEKKDGALAFYIVNKNGLFIQASDNVHGVSNAVVPTIARKILADPVGAAARYGQAIGKCGRCGRTLTDEASRALGLGPVCAEGNWA